MTSNSDKPKTRRRTVRERAERAADRLGIIGPFYDSARKDFIETFMQKRAAKRRAT